MVRKVFVEVIARFDLEGRITPLQILWEDGRRFRVDRVLEARRAASLKAGGVGMRYTCLIAGRSAYIWYEGPKWFVEGRE